MFVKWRGVATSIGRHPERGRDDPALIEAILDEALICHVGFVVGGYPAVIPTIHARAGATLYLHGSPASRMLQAAPGTEVCVTVTLLDGIVMARSAFNHSMNYRSVVVYGRPRVVTDAAEKLAAFEALVEHVASRRWADARRPTASEMTATTVLHTGTGRGFGEGAQRPADRRDRRPRTGDVGGGGSAGHAGRGTPTDPQLGARDRRPGVRPPIPPAALMPAEWSEAEIRSFGYQVVDLIAESMSTIDRGPVFRPVPPEIAAGLSGEALPGEGLPAEAILADFRDRVLPYPMGNGHRRFWGWVNSPPAVIGVFAEALAAAMNPSVAGGNHAAVHLEHGVLNWFKELFGFPADSGGLLVSGSSVATLVGLAVAPPRARRIRRAIRRPAG